MGTYVLQAELRMDANKVVKEWKYLVNCWLLQGIEPGLLQWEVEITTMLPPINDVFEIIPVFVYLYGWGCCEVELQSKWKKWKRKSKKNDVGGTWETQWKWNRIWEAWMVRKSPVMRWKIYRAAARCDGREAGRVDSNARRLKSSSSLRVDAIQAIDIFIRGCYL